mgnify:CR=1 FL=1
MLGNFAQRQSWLWNCSIFAAGPSSCSARADCEARLLCCGPGLPTRPQPSAKVVVRPLRPRHSARCCTSAMGVHATQSGYLAALSDADAGAAGVRARPTSRCPSPLSAQVIGQVQHQRHGTPRSQATRPPSLVLMLVPPVCARALPLAARRQFLLRLCTGTALAARIMGVQRHGLAAQAHSTRRATRTSMPRGNISCLAARKLQQLKLK